MIDKLPLSLDPLEAPLTPGGQYDDLVGYIDPVAVNYYRVERPLRGLPLPCEYNDFQEVFIFCGELPNRVPRSFVKNVLVGRIGATTIFSGRGDQGAGRTWP
jgi:hypothetical protein